jgi:putative addiction module component (TIGR02574 family)
LFKLIRSDLKTVPAVYQRRKENNIMTTKSEFIVNEALTMSPDERARIARCLIQSLEEPCSENVDEQWIQFAQKRFEELEAGSVSPTTWEEIKKNIGNRKNA